MILNKQECLLLGLVVLVMLVYFLIATPVMTDDGFHYEGFTEALAKGKLDFKSFYGFQGLSFFAVIVFWLTRSHDSIIITSAIFSLFSVPLIYFIGRNFYQSSRAGIYFLILFLLTPYPYTTMMRGFQEAALLFFVLLVIYGSINKKMWISVVWAVGGIVKPFALVLLPLFLKEILPTDKRHSMSFIRGRRFLWLVIALAIGAGYLGASYYQIGHLVNNAAINSYQGNFDTGNPPPLVESFTFEIKGYLRVIANLILSFRKIMVSPFIVVLGGLALLLNKSLKLRKEIIIAVVLNFLLVGSLSFSFSKYLIPMTTLFSLASVSYLLKYRWLMFLVFADSLFVFLPIWNYFGKSFWPNIYVYLIPLWLAVTLSIIQNAKFKNENDEYTCLPAGRKS